MQDGKALQAGTSHFLGQNFAKAFDVTFLSKENKREFVWATSWGVSTRLMGALVMTHSDDDGLIVPPNLAPVQVVFVPMYKTDEERAQTERVCHDLAAKLKAQGIRVKVDDDDTQRPGWKFAEYELKGVPLRVAVGPRDLATEQVEFARRDTKEKFLVHLNSAVDQAVSLMSVIQENMYLKAKTYRDQNTYVCNDYQEMQRILDTTGGFISAHWDGTSETEELIKQETKATIRCIPIGNPVEDGQCIRTGKPSKQRVLFARAY